MRVGDNYRILLLGQVIKCSNTSLKTLVVLRAGYCLADDLLDCQKKEMNKLGTSPPLRPVPACH